MEKGRLALEFKLDTRREMVEETGRKFDGESKSAAWFVCARSSDAMLASKDHLTLIRHLAASRSLSIIVKSGNSPVNVVQPTQILRKQMPISPRSPLSATSLASTSLQTIQPRSSQLLGHAISLKTNNLAKPGISTLPPQHSASTPNIAATISASSSYSSKKKDTIKEEEASSDEDWANDFDDVPERSDTPPLISFPSQSASSSLSPHLSTV